MKKDIIERIINKLYDYEGETVYSCDLAYKLFEGENIDGSFTYSSYEAKKWIKNYFDDIGEVWEELEFEFGGDFLKNYNLFENPEKFMCLIIIESASYILGKCEIIKNKWDEELTLNKKTITTIEKQLQKEDNGGSIYE